MPPKNKNKNKKTLKNIYEKEKFIIFVWFKKYVPILQWSMMKVRKEEKKNHFIIR